MSTILDQWRAKDLAHARKLLRLAKRPDYLQGDPTMARMLRLVAEHRDNADTTYAIQHNRI